jgi:hypothetical protein
VSGASCKYIRWLPINAAGASLSTSRSTMEGDQHECLTSSSNLLRTWLLVGCSQTPIPVACRRLSLGLASRRRRLLSQSCALPLRNDTVREHASPWPAPRAKALDWQAQWSLGGGLTGIHYAPAVLGVPHRYQDGAYQKSQ